MADIFAVSQQAASASVIADIILIAECSDGSEYDGRSSTCLSNDESRVATPSNPLAYLTPRLRT